MWQKYFKSKNFRLIGLSCLTFVCPRTTPSKRSEKEGVIFGKEVLHSSPCRYGLPLTRLNCHMMDAHHVLPNCTIGPYSGVPSTRGLRLCHPRDVIANPVDFFDEDAKEGDIQEKGLDMLSRFVQVGTG